MTEVTHPHPVRATDGLPHWYQPWLDVTPAQLAERGLSKWQRFVDQMRATDTVPVIDGQIVYGDVTNMFLMDAGSPAIVDYSRALESVIRPLTPLLIYFYQDDVDRAIRVIAAERGQEWVKYQVDWKLQAPYCRRRGLSGLEGLVVLYRDYRALTDALYAGSGLSKLAIENSQRTWSAYHERIMREILGSENGHAAI